MERHFTRSRVFSIILYLLPIIFSLITVFFITTSGEDNFQGAGNLQNGNPINILQDAKNAFNFNSRITDVYAWTVIDFYDNQFNFGPDIFLRLLDVIAITSVFYLMTYLILNRKPSFKIKDSLIFCAVFFVFIITPFGRAFYHEFSMIHNYVPLALITILFVIPYLKLVTHSIYPKHSILFSILMLLAGLVFGMSATITPLAFLATTVIYIIYLSIKQKHFPSLPFWSYAGAVGAVSGFLICWLVGSGINHYTDTTVALTFDYLPLSDIFSNIPKLIWHEIYNFGIVLIPLIIILIFCLFFSRQRKKLFNKTHLAHLSSTTISYLIIFATFIIIHILGASLVKSPPRLLIPAYLAGIIIVFRFFIPHLEFNKLSSTLIITLTLATVIAHGILLTKYHSEMSKVLSYIKNSPETTICLSPTDTMPPRIRILDLSQANMIVNWGEPEPIYDKGVVSCQ